AEDRTSEPSREFPGACVIAKPVFEASLHCSHSRRPEFDVRRAKSALFRRVRIPPGPFRSGW
ncbi:MAG: hypothetical protein KIT32_08725, partial [Rhodocyclaceae bacterium]|nr:hypothetical protein [Rhodocyclaceae bacterium]